MDEISEKNSGSKKRLFVDMDGTLSKFTPVEQLETLYEEGYFYNQEPLVNVIESIKNIIASDENEVEVFILSTYFTDSRYALQEKNDWLDEFMSGKQIKDIPPNAKTQVIDTESGEVQLTYERKDGCADLERFMLLKSLSWPVNAPLLRLGSQRHFMLLLVIRYIYA